PEQVLERDGTMQYLDHQTPAPTIVHFDTPIDQLCVSKHFRELQRNSLTVHGVRGASERLQWRKTFSDHFPVTARLTPLADDDPSATFSQGGAEQVLPITRRAGSTTAARGDTRTALWPPVPGAQVEMYVENRLVKGTLIHLPAERGWVVVDSGKGA